MEILVSAAVLCLGTAGAGELVRTYLRRALATPRPVETASPQRAELADPVMT